MKVAVFAGLGLVSASLQEEFVAYVKEFNKVYTPEELFSRFQNFRDNKKMIDEHNAKGLRWEMGVNQFTDLTQQEFSDLYLGYIPRSNEYARSRNYHVAPAGQVLADSLDWRTKGAVTPIKDQAQCGSCWAFSTTGSVEGANQIKSGQLQSLSEQQLVDCAGSAGNQGCNGGLMDDAFEYIIKNGGIGSEASYPYTGHDGKCKQVPSVATVSKYTDVKKNDETGLMSAVNIEPVSVAVDAQSWSSYRKGVMSGFCGKQLDHGVLAIGYGTDGGQDYWLVKNSWGTSWGEQGTIRLIREKNECGIAEAASYPTP
jgi:C1A family cysteine protease